MIARLLKLILGVVVYLAFAALMALLIIEWLSGCGETYVDAKGERHAYECVLIPQEKTK